MTVGELDEALMVESRERRQHLLELIGSPIPNEVVLRLEEKGEEEVGEEIVGIVEIEGEGEVVQEMAAQRDLRRQRSRHKRRLLLQTSRIYRQLLRKRLQMTTKLRQNWSSPSNQKNPNLPPL
jgi:hypothetical protein